MMRVLGALLVMGAPLFAVAACGAQGTSQPTGTPTATESAASSPGTATVSPEATIKVQDSGFSQRGTDVGWGAILRNQSSTQDAAGVDVTVNLLSNTGAILDTETRRLSIIPAGVTFFAGGYVAYGSLTASDRVTRIEVTADVVSSTAAQSYPLPRITHVRLISIAGYRYVGELTRVVRSLMTAWNAPGLTEAPFLGGSYPHRKESASHGKTSEVPARVSRARHTHGSRVAAIHRCRCC
jgi:hypothetical protein